MDRLGLAAEGVETSMVEIGSGEMAVPEGRPAPRSVIEALGGNRDIVAVEHAVDEPGGDVGGGEPCRAFGGPGQQARGGILVFAFGFLAEIMVQAIVGQRADIVVLVEESEPLEGPDPYMAVAQPDQHRRSGGGGLVVALQRLAGLDQGEGLAGLDAERLEHFRGENLTHRALERQPAVAESAIGCLAGSLGAEIEQSSFAVAKLCEQEAAAVADVGIVHPELMAVIAQRQRRREVVGQRLEAPEMTDPGLVVQLAEADCRCPAIVAVPQDRLRKIRRFDGVVKGVAQRGDGRSGR